MSGVAGVAAFTAMVGAAQGIKESNRANRFNKRAMDLQEEQFELFKKQLDDFQAIYGPIEENLGAFYNTLTPDYFAAQGLQAFNQEFQQNQEEMREFFAANEIPSGVQVDLEQEANLSAARERAQIKTDAPFKVAEAQQGFLSLGLNRLPGVNTNVQNAGNSLTNTINQQGDIARSNANAGFEAFETGLTTLANEYDRRQLEQEQRQTTTANQGTTEIN